MFALGNLLHPLQHTDAAYRSATWEIAHVLIVLAIIPMLLGLPELIGALRRRGATTSATLTHVLLVVGFVGMASTLLAEAFLAPEVGHATMERFNDTGFGAVGGVLGMAWLPGLVALSLACRKAQLVAATPRWAIAISAVVLLLVASGTSRAVGAAIIACTAVIGLGLAAIGLRVARSR